MNMRNFFNTSKGKRKVWINFIPYANRLFAAGREDLWNNPDTFISVYSQGQGLIQSDLLSIPVEDVYLDLLQREKELIEHWNGKRPTFALKKLLALEEPKQYVIDVLTGLKNLYQNSQPFVLVLPSSQSWLRMIHAKIRPNEDFSVTDDDIEAVSMYLAEYLRNFSTLGLSGIVIDETCLPSVNVSKALPLYQPVLNVAKHYQWMVGMEVQDLSEQLQDSLNEIDFALSAHGGIVDLVPLWEKGMMVGGGLNRAFWMESSNRIEQSNTGFTYGKIPEDTEPEKVLARLQELRA